MLLPAKKQREAVSHKKASGGGCDVTVSQLHQAGVYQLGNDSFRSRGSLETRAVYTVSGAKAQVQVLEVILFVSQVFEAFDRGVPVSQGSAVLIQRRIIPPPDPLVERMGCRA